MKEKKMNINAGKNKSGKKTRISTPEKKRSIASLPTTVKKDFEITGQTRAKARSRATEERYRTIMMSVGDGVIATDTEGRVEMMNPVAEALTGWTHEESLGKPLEEVFHIVNEETRQTVENPIRKVMREGMVVGLANHTVLIARNGREHPIADSGAPIRNERNDITGVVLVFRDQTQERMAQKALKESEVKFRDTVKYLDEAYYSVTTDGLLIEHNQAYNRILGIDITQDLKGQETPDFWQNPEDRKPYLNELMAQGFINNYLVKAKKIDGKKIVVLMNSHMVRDEKGGLLRIEGNFTDFTERKRAEEALASSEQFLSNVIEQSPVSLWISDSEGTLMKMNQACRELFGITDEETVGKYNLLKDNLIEAQGFMALVGDVFKKGEIARFIIDYDLPRVEHIEVKEGTHRILDVVLSPIKDIHGKLTNVLVQHKDITESKRAEEALRESGEKFSKAFQTSPYAITITRAEDGGFIEVNDAFTLIAGYTREEALTDSSVGLKLWANEEDREIVVSDLRAGRAVEGREYQFRTKSGKNITGLFSAQIIKLSSCPCILSSINDITERKQAEEAVQESEERFRTAAESLTDVVYDWDIKDKVDWYGDIDGIMGYPPGGFPRTIEGWAVTIHPEDKDRVMAALEGHLKGLAPYIVEYRVGRRDGEWRWWSARGTALRDDLGEPYKMIGSITDITERLSAEQAGKQAEEEIRRLNDELEENVKQRTAQLRDVLELNQKIINTSSLGIFACKEDGPCIIANPAVARISGTSVEQMLKINFRELDSWKKNGLFQKVETALQTKAEQRAEIHLTTSFGRDAWINYYITTFTSRGKLNFLMTVEDITERKLVELEIARANLYNRSLLEASVDPLVTIGPEGKITDVNKSTEAITGRTRQELIGTEFSGYFTDPEKANAGYRQVFAEGLVRNYELQLQHKDGHITPVHYNATVYRDDSGCVIGIFAAAHDVTEMKSAAAKLMSSKQLLDETGRLARVGGWELDLKTNVLSFSDVTKQIHEVDPEYQPTLEVAINFYAPEAIPVISEAVRCAIEEGEPYDVELELITAKQNRLWVRTVGQAYRDNGKIVKIGGVFQDINERKLAEIEFRKKSEQLQLLSNELEIIIDSIPGLVFYKDTNNRFIRVNKYMSDAYKMPKKHLEGVHLNDLHSKEQAQAYYEDDLEVIRSRKSKINIDEPWETETGIRWVSTSKIPYMDEKGDVVGVIGVSMDVTERRKLEDSLRDHVVKTETLNKELEAFTYSVSHDLRAPLRHVSGYVELLTNRFKQALSEKGVHYLDSIADSVHQMGKLIDDLLQFSRTGRAEMRMTKLEMNEIVAEVLESMGKATPDHTIEWVVEKLPSVYGDDATLRHVWMNLLGNAVKFTQTREKALIEIGATVESKEIIYFVKDNGVGFDMKYAQKLFGVFQRLHSTEEFEGTGIGLANVNRIVMRHGGRTWAEAELDKGAIFYFSIPHN
jgi:PAS domain S-box-containing protein